jgi:hypothetical protein
MSDLPPFAKSNTRRPLNVLRSILRRALASVGVLSAGMCGLLLYLALLGTRFAWYQNVAVCLSIVIASVAIVTGLWISWGLSATRRFSDFLDA